MKRKDFLLVGIILLAAGLFLLVGHFSQPQSSKKPADTLTFSKESGLDPGSFNMEADSYLLIKQGQSYYPLVPLNTNGEITLRQEGGRENIVHFGVNSVRMHSANCPGHDCVKMGEMTLDNIEYRVTQRWITCLPHEISLELIPAQDASHLLEAQP